MSIAKSSPNMWTTCCSLKVSFKLQPLQLQSYSVFFMSWLCWSSPQKKCLHTVWAGVTKLAGCCKYQPHLIESVWSKSWPSGAAGADLLPEVRQWGSARCVSWQFDWNHVEPDLNHLMVLTTQAFLIFFFCLFLSYAHADRSTHIHMLGPSNPIPLYLLSSSLHMPLISTYCSLIYLS